MVWLTQRDKSRKVTQWSKGRVRSYRDVCRWFLSREMIVFRVTQRGERERDGRMIVAIRSLQGHSHTGGLSFQRSSRVEQFFTKAKKFGHNSIREDQNQLIAIVR